MKNLCHNCRTLPRRIYSLYFSNDLSYIFLSLSIIHNHSIPSLDFFYWFMIQSCSFWEQFRMVVIWCRVFEFSVGKDCRLYIDDGETGSSILTFSKFYNSLTGSMNSLILTYNHILTTMPFKTSLPCYNIIRHNFSTTKNFQTTLI